LTIFTSTSTTTTAAATAADRFAHIACIIFRLDPPAESSGISLEFVEASAEALPFDDSSFDAVTIAFGLRNVR
jgi:hypothetical protein